MQVYKVKWSDYAVLAYDAAIEALDDANHPLHHVQAMRETALVAAVDATGGDYATARHVSEDAVNTHITERC